MKLSAIIFLLAIIASAVLYYSHSQNSSEDYEKLADKITITTAKSLEEKNGLILLGTGGRMMDDIKLMSMAFEYHEAGNIETARKLLLDSTKEYLSKINASERIRPYLHNYPFTPTNIKIEIYFRGIAKSDSAEDKVDIAALSDGMFFYFVKDENSTALKLIKEESYEGSH